MKNNTRTRTLISFVLAISLLSLPITAFAKKGDKNFKRGAEYEKQQQWQEQQFGTVALPLYAIVDPNGRPLKTFAGLTRSPAEFLSFLRTVPQENGFPISGE